MYDVNRDVLIELRQDILDGRGASVEKVGHSAERAPGAGVDEAGVGFSGLLG